MCNQNGKKFKQKLAPQFFENGSFLAKNAQKMTIFVEKMRNFFFEKLFCEKL
jgi:hypothetical protein